ncbi:helix-turn-helix domain-containing protein [Lottiidibacillus patelloidae]|nr:helix-turn-helix domain-containing protein [Lottiidibacillus patelloidae]
MDYSQIGKEIKIIRKTQGISQKQLSEGICTQAQISKIEKGEVHPLSSTLYLLAKRLGVDVNYLYQVGYAPHHQYVQEVELQIRQAVHAFDFDIVKEMIKVEKKNPLYKKSVDFKQFILWNEGISMFHVHKDPERSILLLEEALQLTKFHKSYLSEREIEILNSIGIIYQETEENEKAIAALSEALESYHHLSYITNEKLFPRICYNFARVLSKVNEFDRSITLCKQGIDWCKKYQLLYLLGELYFQTGLNYKRMKDFERSKSYFIKAVPVLKLLDKQHLVDHINNRFLSKEEYTNV